MAKAKIKPGDWVRVDWVDSVGMVGNVWFDRDQVAKQTVETIQSAGCVIANTKEALVIAAHVGAGNQGDVSGDMCIPWCAVTKCKKVAQ